MKTVLDMRTQRQLSEDVKAKISQAMKKFHDNRSETAKQRTREKQSLSMTEYWSTVPDGAEIGSDIKACKPCKSSNGQPIKKR